MAYERRAARWSRSQLGLLLPGQACCGATADLAVCGGCCGTSECGALRTVVAMVLECPPLVGAGLASGPLLRRLSS